MAKPKRSHLFSMFLGIFVLLISSYHLGVPFEKIYPGKSCLGLKISNEGFQPACEYPLGERRPLIGMFTLVFGGVLIWAALSSLKKDK